MITLAAKAARAAGKKTKGKARRGRPPGSKNKAHIERGHRVKKILRKIHTKKKTAKVGKKKASKVGKKVGKGRGRPAKSAKSKLAAKHAWYMKNRAKLLKYQKNYYKKHRAHIIQRVNKWRKRTKNGTSPYYAQGKKNGHKPRWPRGPILNPRKGGVRGRDTTTGKRPATTLSARKAVKKTEQKAERKSEKARGEGKRKNKSLPRPKRRPAKKAASKKSPSTFKTRLPATKAGGKGSKGMKAKMAALRAKRK